MRFNGNLLKSALCAAVTAVAANAGALAAQESETVIRFSHHHAVDSLLDRTAKKFAEELESKDVNMSVEVFPAAQLGGEQENAEGVQGRTVDMTISSTVFFNKWVDGMGFELLPFLFRDSEHVRTALAPEAEVTESIRLELSDKAGVHLLGFLDTGFRDFAMQGFAVETPDDLKGRKIRVPEIWTWIRMYQLLEANGTPVTFNETYTALSAGVVEGLDMPAAILIDNRFFEVVTHVSKAGVISTPMALTINGSAYASLSEEQRIAVSSSAIAALDYGNNESTNDTLSAYKMLEDAGIIINEVDIAPFAEKVRPMYDDFVERSGGREYIDAILSN